MSRRILLVCAGLTAITAFSFALLFWLGGRDVSAGPLQRSITPWATTPAGLVQVRLALDGAQLSRCDQQEKPLDAVLVLDRSDSMEENNALSLAANSAVVFAQLLQGQEHRVGVVIFNEVAQRLTPLGSALSDLKTGVGNLTADGGTNITDALLEAGAILREASRPEASPVIVLLSDGGAQEPNTALQVAQQLKDQGVLLVTVGLPGADFSPALLRSLASTPDDFYQTDAPSLPEVYRGLARSLRSAVASDVKVRQPYPAAHFEVDAPSVQPSSGVVTANMINWSLPVLRSGSAGFSYQLRPATIGWHDVTGSSGEVTMVDCAGAPLVFPLMLGPRVFVSPIPPWLWLFSPFLFFVPLFILGRRGKPIGPLKLKPEPLAFDFVEKPAPFTWLDDVVPLESQARAAHPPSYTDALVVGVGRSGRVVLAELRRLLCEQSSGQMPAKIRLLWVDARLGQSSSEGTPPSGLEVEETLILQPNLEEVSEQLEKKDPAWTHLHWWGEHSVDDPGRAGARMALFYDLMLGEGQSHIWRALRRRLDGLHQPLIYVVGSLADKQESGLALDLPHFIRQATEEMGTGARRVITMFLLQRTGTHIAEDRDAARHTYAAARELQRILLRERFVYEYNPHAKGKLVGSTETTPIDACYLLDGRGVSEDLSHLPEESALYPTIADALVTLLSSDVATWHQDYINKLPDITSRAEKSTGRPTVSSLGVSVVAYPMAGLKRVCQARFLLDLIFGGEDGRSSLGLARLDPGRPQPTLEARAGLDGLEPRQRALTFLSTGGTPNRHPLMGAIADLMRDTAVSEDILASYVPSDQRIDRAFLWSLRDELLHMLNGSGSGAINSRTGKLGAALAFLNGLTELLRDAEVQAPQRITVVRETELRSHLAARIASWRRIAENTLAETQRWEAVFVGGARPDRSATSSTRTRHRSSPEPFQQRASLYGTFKAQLAVAQADLARAAQPPLRKLVGYDEKSQIALYQKYLGPELLKTSGLQPLEQAMKRIGWWAVADLDREIVELRLVVVEPDKDGRKLNRYNLGFTADQAEAIQEALQRVTGHFLPLLDVEQFSTQLESLKLDGLSTALLKGVNPLITYVRTFIGSVGGTVSRHLVLTMEDEKLRTDLSNELRRSHDLPPLEIKSSDDPFRCALVGLTDAIPIESLEAIDEAALDYSSDSLAHIFPAEQEAARLESEWRLRRGRDHRFHPRFVRLFDNADLIRLMVLADLYGLVTRRREGNEEQAFLSIPENNGPVTVELARGHDTSLFPLLERAFHLWLTAEPSHPLSRNRWSRTRRALEEVIKKERDNFDDLYTFAEMKRDEAAQRLQEEEERERSDRDAVVRRRWERDVDVYLWLLADAEKREALKK